MWPSCNDRLQVPRFVHPSLQASLLQGRPHRMRPKQNRTPEQRRQELIRILDMALEITSPSVDEGFEDICS